MTADYSQPAVLVFFYTLPTIYQFSISGTDEGTE